MRPAPLVSVYIPTRNRLEKLERALRSVLGQTYANHEILVCDDASTDGTFERISRLARSERKIRYLRNPAPRGACSARNLGIFAARGEFITGLDDDDEFTPDRLETLLDAWDDGYAFVCSNFWSQRPGQRLRAYYPLQAQTFTLRQLLLKNLATNQVLTRTGRLQDIGGFREGVRRLQDWDTWLRLCSGYGGRFHRARTPLYVMHHDHEAEAQRVSRSIALDVALEELCERNRDLYDARSRRLLLSHARELRGEFSLGDLWLNTLHRRNSGPLRIYLRQHLRKLDPALRPGPK
ncbi:Glycosyl transferase, family 2 protein [Azotobacter vinelandii CA]|uniref:Glycosyl transferase, family 2 protein n=2 Tax=Azotobacter vinelandii TaxID=354 RepID=C1DM76_AZOVD|nr:glycosyltransferase family 2 protein [Azotobacter vinelandii]ACO79163.1 Glycosyl transferase, family 2 protein [Azotobacter vinelandii DJ]AGK14787.1 Glycosyl transferase, family 2 protein [Azotobacter vinelandii CA]AGK21013.1 Glycosyl transferase, family 2 protein [Azotobacter vinelandii CA6]SFX74980.1 Glycosyltransferase involved in cell wall bisynthesis [Azotobacter vinelandii]GLK58327.1 glycosyl transferase family 2 [Azotobacter vinelandii]